MTYITDLDIQPLTYLRMNSRLNMLNHYVQEYIWPSAMNILESNVKKSKYMTKI